MFPEKHEIDWIFYIQSIRTWNLDRTGRERRTIVFLRTFPVSKLFRFLVRGNERRGEEAFFWHFITTAAINEATIAGSATRLCLCFCSVASLVKQNIVGLCCCRFECWNPRLFPWQKYWIPACKSNRIPTQNIPIHTHIFPELDHHTHAPFLGVTQPFCSHVRLQNHFGGWRQMGKWRAINEFD